MKKYRCGAQGIFHPTPSIFRTMAYGFLSQSAMGRDGAIFVVFRQLAVFKQLVENLSKISSKCVASCKFFTCGCRSMDWQILFMLLLMFSFFDLVETSVNFQIWPYNNYKGYLETDVQFQIRPLLYGRADFTIEQLGGSNPWYLCPCPSCSLLDGTRTLAL